MATNIMAIQTAALLLLLATGHISEGRRRPRSKQNMYIDLLSGNPANQSQSSVLTNDVISEWHSADNQATIEVIPDNTYRLKKPKKQKNQVWENLPPEDPTIYMTSNEVVATSAGQLDTVVTMLQRLSTEVANLRSQMGTVKYHNHLIYKQLKQLKTSCLTAAPALQHKSTMCPKNFSWNEELQKCFLFTAERTSWRMARERCQVMDASLISISNSHTQRFVIDTARKTKEFRHCDFWIGATDKNDEGSWRWSANNQELLYQNWNHNEPNNGSGDENCAMMLWVFNWKWNDARCKMDNACFICESSMM